MDVAWPRRNGLSLEFPPELLGILQKLPLDGFLLLAQAVFPGLEGFSPGAHFGIDEGVVIPPFGPGAAGDAVEFHKAPVDDGRSAGDAQVVADGGGDVDARSLVLGVDGGLVAEDIGPVFRGEGAAVLPLGKAGALVVDDLHPPAFADGLPFPRVFPAEPRDDA